MRLRGARVVVKADLPGDKIGSLYIPDRAKQQPLSGVIVLLGEGAVGDVQVGDRVLFPSRAWSRFNAPGYGFPFMLLWAKDLIAVIDAVEVPG
jgi:co-chaperonin GroES (HSP10)